MGDISKYDDKTLIDFLDVDVEKALRERGYEYGWYNKNLLKSDKPKIFGSIYILVSSFYDDVIKIGFSENPLEYVNSLNECNQSLMDEYHCYAIYNVTLKIDMKDIKSLISVLFSDSIFSSYHEDWITFSKEKAFDILYAIARLHNNVDNLILNPFDDEYFNEIKVSPENNNKVIVVGDRIKHCDNGLGTVKSITKKDNEISYYVVFDNGTSLTLNSYTFEDGYAYKIKED